jgi:hypothetical protein
MTKATAKVPSLAAAATTAKTKQVAAQSKQITAPSIVPASP